MSRGTSDSRKIIEELGFRAKRFDEQTLTVFIEELLRYNPHLGLVSKRSPEKVISKLLKLSVQLRDFIAEKTRILGTPTRVKVADIGSGGGFPGVAWRLMDDGMEVTLIERRERKALFLKRLSYVLGLEGLDVLDMDAGSVAAMDAFRGRFGLAVTLAVGGSDAISKAAGELLKPSGFYCTVRSGKEKVYPSILAGELHMEAATIFANAAVILYKKRGS